MNKIIGQNIKENLVKKNMKQKQLAELTGLKEVTIGRYINGTREPNATNIIKIAEALEISTDELLGVKNKKIVSIAKIIEKAILNLPSDDKLNLIKELL